MEQWISRFLTRKWLLCTIYSSDSQLVACFQWVTGLCLGKKKKRQRERKKKKKNSVINSVIDDNPQSLFTYANLVWWIAGTTWITRDRDFLIFRTIEGQINAFLCFNTVIFYSTVSGSNCKIFFIKFIWEAENWGGDLGLALRGDGGSRGQTSWEPLIYRML